jgi:small subunit ribosomal protein S16
VAVVLRTQRLGHKKHPFYRIVVTEKLGRRDGRFIELIGTYDPMPKTTLVKLNEERIKHWIELGALPTEIVRSLIVKNIPGYIEGKEKARREKIQAKRRVRKAKLAKGKGTAKAKK